MGTSVGTVTATDDAGEVLTYSDDSDYFDVDGSGNITTTMMLDHEAMASHTVTVTATDGRGRIGQHHRDHRGWGHVPRLHGCG